MVYLSLLALLASPVEVANASYWETRALLETRLHAAEQLKLRLESLQPQEEARKRHWSKRQEENLWAQTQHKHKKAQLAQACLPYARGISRLGAHGAKAMHAGQGLGAWAVAHRRLRALLLRCESQRQHLSEEGSQLLRKAQQLGQLEESLVQTQARLEELAQKLHLHIPALSNALTALPDFLQAQPLTPPREVVDMAHLKGQLFPPAFGFIEKPFGAVVHPTSHTATHHAGIRIRVAPGSWIRSIAPGKVAYVGKLQGLGKLVILEHAGGFHTLAAHLQETFIEAGEELPKGAWLGSAGEKSGEASVYFEIRHQGKAQNPEGWFVPSSFRGYP